VPNAPVDGGANDAVVRLLAAELGLSRSSVTIERGATARVKLIAANGVTRREVLFRWPGLRLRAAADGENDARPR
jgi:uncharacterized protein YggU (UPF0235/DUF167 family)